MWIALPGAFSEHLQLLKGAAEQIETPKKLEFILVKTPTDLERCSALIIPGKFFYSLGAALLASS